MLLQPRCVRRVAPDPQPRECGKNAAIQNEVPGEREIAARVSETAAGNIDPAGLRGDGHRDEHDEERDRDEERTVVEPAENERQPANNFQPGQIKREPHANRPGDDLVVANVDRELRRVVNLHDPGVNKNRAGQKTERAPNERASNEAEKILAACAHFPVFCHSSQPPCKT